MGSVVSRASTEKRNQSLDANLLCHLCLKEQIPVIFDPNRRVPAEAKPYTDIPPNYITAHERETQGLAILVGYDIQDGECLGPCGRVFYIPKEEPCLKETMRRCLDKMPGIVFALQMLRAPVGHKLAQPYPVPASAAPTIAGLVQFVLEDVFGDNPEPFGPVYEMPRQRKEVAAAMRKAVMQRGVKNGNFFVRLKVLRYASRED